MMFFEATDHKYHLCNLRTWFSYVPSNATNKKHIKINEKILRETWCLWGTIMYVLLEDDLSFMTSVFKFQCSVVEWRWGWAGCNCLTLWLKACECNPLHMEFKQVQNWYIGMFTGRQIHMYPYVQLFVLLWYHKDHQLLHWNTEVHSGAWTFCSRQQFSPAVGKIEGYW